MHLGERFGCRVPQFVDVTRLSTGLVVREHAARRQVQWELRIGSVGRRAVGHAVESGAAARCGKAVREQPRCARVIGARARPEQAVFHLDALVGDASIVCRRASGRLAELVEDIASTVKREMRPLAESRRERAEDVDVSPHACRRIDGTAAQDDAAFEVGHCPVLFGPLRRRQDDIGQFRRLREKEISHHQKVERLETPLNLHGIWRRHHDVRTHDQQRTHAALGPD